MKIQRGKRVLAAFAASMTIAWVGAPVLACELAGPNTHIGKIKAIEVAQESLTILDFQMKKDLTFQAVPEQLKGLSMGQVVAVKYSEANGKLKAEEIEPR